MYVPKKWWWVVAVAVPVTVAVIAIVPDLIRKGGPGSGDTFSVAGTQFNGDVVFNEITVVVEQVQRSGGEELPDSVLEMLRQATDFARSRDFDKAIPLLESAAGAAPVPAVYNNLGAAYLATGNREKAKQYLEQALTGSPDEQTARFNLSALAYFAYEPFGEAAEHVHYAVVFEKGHGEKAVGHLPVLIVRARGDYKDIQTRAKYIAERLNSALIFLKKGAKFRIIEEGPDLSIFIMPPGYDKIRVLNIHSQDVAGELKRCRRQVDSHLLARFWKAWLEDFVELFVHHRMPSKLVDTHAGLVLKHIYTQAKALGDGVVNDKSIHESVDLLADSHWRSLDELAGCVVRGFE